MRKIKGISFVIWSVFVTILLTVTIIGLALGLTNLYKKDYKVNDEEKLEDCKILSCKDDALINRKYSVTVTMYN